MSRVSEIQQAEEAVTRYEKILGDTIHQIYRSDREIWYQVGFSEHPSSWAKYVVVGSYDKFKITIRPVGGGPSIVIDGRSWRLQTKIGDENSSEVTDGSH